jgi:hypothetical protein
MDLEYFVEPVFKIDFLKIKCNDWNNKKTNLKTTMDQFAEIGKKEYFYSNRDSCTLDHNSLSLLIPKEIELLEKAYGKINITSVWSASYGLGQYHPPHNHGAEGYAAILYLDYLPDHSPTIYMQPWNDDMGKSVLFKPPVEEGDIVVAPKFITHYTEPSKMQEAKRIIGFDFLIHKKVK